MAFQRQGINKFRNNKGEYQGDYYDSGMEARYAQLLNLLKKATNDSERVVRWEKQIKLELTAHGEPICNHYVDFRVWYADGRDEYHEVKGYPDKVYPIKRKIMLAQYPKMSYRVFVEKGGVFYERKDFSRPR